MRISDWSSDVCSFDLIIAERAMIARIVGFDEDDRKADRLIGLRPDAQHLPVIFAQPVLDRSRFPRLHRERDADALHPRRALLRPERGKIGAEDRKSVV